MRVERVKGEVAILRVCKDVRVQSVKGGHGYTEGTKGKGGLGYNEGM